MLTYEDLQKKKVFSDVLNPEKRPNTGQNSLTFSSLSAKVRGVIRLCLEKVGVLKPLYPQKVVLFKSLFLLDEK